MELPRLKITYPYAMYNAEMQMYMPSEVEVEVLTLHLHSGGMRVRTLERIAVFKDCTPRRLTFDTDIAPFFEHYKIERAYDHS